MNVNDLRKKVRVEITAPVYFGGRYYNGGERADVELFNFNHVCMIALDKNGRELEEQPILDRAEVNAAFAAEKAAKEAQPVKKVVKDEDEDYFNPNQLKGNEEVTEVDSLI